MIRISKIVVHNFKCFNSDQKLELEDGITGIVGMNGSGKSVLLELLSIFSKPIYKWILEDDQYHIHKKEGKVMGEKGVTAFFELSPSSDFDKKIEKHDKASENKNINHQIVPFSFKVELYYGKKPRLTMHNIAMKDENAWKRVHYSLVKDSKQALEFPNLSNEELMKDLKWQFTLASPPFDGKSDHRTTYAKGNVELNKLNYMRRCLIYLALLRRAILIETDEDDLVLIHSRIAYLMLFDNPGSSLLPYERKKFLLELRKFVKNSKNQVIYATHLPLMVDEQYYNEVRVTGKDEKGITTIQRAENGNFQKLFKNLFQKVRKTYLVSGSKKRSGLDVCYLLVEGKSDKYFLKTFHSWFNKREKDNGLENIRIIFMGGKDKKNYYINVCTVMKINFVMLLDKDKQGKDGEKIRQQKDQGFPIVSCADVLSNNQRAAEIEDIFSIPDYLKLVAKTYHFVELEYIQKKIKNYGDGTEKIKKMLGRLFFKEYNTRERFDHMRVAQKFHDIKNTIGIEYFDSSTRGQFEKLIKRIKEENNNWKTSKASFGIYSDQI